MSKFNVSLVRVEYLSQEFTIEAETEREAIDQAWDKSGTWKRLDTSEEYVDYVEEV